MLLEAEHRRLCLKRTSKLADRHVPARSCVRKRRRSLKKKAVRGSRPLTRRTRENNPHKDAISKCSFQRHLTVSLYNGPCKLIFFIEGLDIVKGKAPCSFRFGTTGLLLSYILPEGKGRQYQQARALFLHGRIHTSGTGTDNLQTALDLAISQPIFIFLFTIYSA